MTSAKIELARIMRERDQQSMTAIAKGLGVGRTTLYRHLTPPAHSSTTT